MNLAQPERHAGIDYDFQPESFWAPPSDPLEAILRNTTGRRGREMIRDCDAARKFEKLFDELLKDSID
jgi:hypothetical protein